MYKEACLVQEGNALQLDESVVEGVRDEVSDPLGEEDGDHDEEQELDVVGHLDHDDGQRHGQPRDAAEEGDGADQGHGAWKDRREKERLYLRICPEVTTGGNYLRTRIQPVPVSCLRDPEDVDHELPEHPPVEGADEEHGHDEARGDVGAGRPARHPVVEQEHR